MEANTNTWHYFPHVAVPAVADYKHSLCLAESYALARSLCQRRGRPPFVHSCINSPVLLNTGLFPVFCYSNVSIDNVISDIA